MKLNIRVISRNVGLALLVSALFMFLSTIVSILNGTDSAFAPLAISCIVTAIVGAFPFIFVREAQAISVKDGYVIIVLSWVLSFTFGMLPYALWGGDFNIINAWFESVSGYTTTGATILTDVEALPRSLLFWRSSTHFIGGLGVVVFLLLILPHASPFRLRMTNLELSSLTREGYRYRSARIIYIIIGVYVSIVVLSMLCLMLAGMPFFDAINHAFSLASTGGFSTKNDSIAAFHSVGVNIVVIIFMLVASLHFGLIYTSFATRSFKPLAKSPVVRFFFGTMFVLIVIATISLKTTGTYPTWGQCLTNSIYQIVCYKTTTGFGMGDNSQWPFVASIVLLVAALQCGCSGSTSGGIKSDRIYMATKVISRQIRQALNPSSVTQIRVGSHYLRDSDALPVVVFIFTYFAIVVIGIFLLLACGMETREAVSGSIAAMGNVGPGLGSISSMCTYASQPYMARIVLTIGMFLGRIEIYPLFAVLYLFFIKEK